MKQYMPKDTYLKFMPNQPDIPVIPTVFQNLRIDWDSPEPVYVYDFKRITEIIINSQYGGTRKVPLHGFHGLKNWCVQASNFENQFMEIYEEIKSGRFDIKTILDRP